MNSCHISEQGWGDGRLGLHSPPAQDSVTWLSFHSRYTFYTSLDYFGKFKQNGGCVLREGEINPSHSEGKRDLSSTLGHLHVQAVADIKKEQSEGFLATCLSPNTK